MGLGGLTAGCLPQGAVAQVPVRLLVTNRTDDLVSIRWKDNKISGSSETIAPGSATSVQAMYTLRGAGDLRVYVLDRNGQTIRVKRYEGEELRAANFSRKLTVTPRRPIAPPAQTTLN